MTHPIPYNAEAEQAVLGSILLEPSCLYDVDLEPSEFWNETNRVIFMRMKELTQRGETPDVVTLGGNTAYLTSLLQSIPSPILVRQYAEAVRRERVRRDLVNASTHIADLAYNGKDVDTVDLVPRAQAHLNHITTPDKGAVIPIADAVAEFMPQLETYIDEQRDVWGIETGLDVDRYIGGLIGGDLTLIAGRPGSGKTSLGMQVAFDVATRGHGVLVFSLEMARRQYMLRLASTLSGINSETIRRGQIDRCGQSYQDIKAPLFEISRAPLWIVDTTQSTDSIRAHAAKMKQAGIDLKFILVDYLDMLTDRGEKDERINGITRALKRVARDFDACVWGLHALNRGAELTLQSLKYGGDYDPDEVVMCDVDPKRTDETANLLIMKNRNGDTCKVPMIFRGGVTRWENPATNTPEPPAYMVRREIVSPIVPSWDDVPMVEAR